MVSLQFEYPLLNARCRHFAHLLFAIVGLGGLFQANLAAQQPSYPLPPPQNFVSPQTAPPSQVLVPAQSNAMSANSSWRGVNYPSGTSTVNYQLPSQSEVLADFGTEPMERDVGLVRQNEFGSYTIPMTSGVDIDEYEWQVLPAEIMYRSYLASQKESRLAAQIVNET
ncbi:MAG: hypothetical protein JNK90_02325, partial [Planctomycetaceae bacterium]|nr:hypothetical protein [Planctomycetaceae bacterium]